jgi:CheY-like chemotaxis protein
VLVSDIGMPGEDGYALIKRVRALGAAGGGSVPSVALTAYAAGPDKTRALAMGYTAHVGKPVDPDRLVTLLASLVQQA